MNDHREDIVNNFTKYSIGLDEVFAFKCRECGKCCKNREDILLNPRDIFNIAIALNLTNEQAISKHCESYIGRDSRIPILRLKPKGANNVCPLLSGNKCSVHRLKPTVCACFPLGRVAVSEAAIKAGALDAEQFSTDTIHYILTDASCGSAKRKQTVRAWLDTFAVPIDDVFFLHWNKTIFTLHTAMRQVEEKTKGFPQGLEMLRNGMFVSLYVDYDTQKEFFPQYEANMSKICGLLDKLQEVF